MEISVRPMTDEDFINAQKILDFKDADTELIEAFKNRQNMYSVLNGNSVAGIAQLKTRKKAVLIIYINPAERRTGIGGSALSLCEQILVNKGAQSIETSFRISDAAGDFFADKNGYSCSYSSTHMEYDGPAFDIPALPVRKYTDDDYEQAHEMYARAFHEMRLRIGCFPDSIIEQPDDSMRKYWNSTFKERYVYTRDDEIIGYAHVTGNEIGSISVKSEYQGQGIGRMFLKFLINKVLEDGYKTVSLYCVVENWAKRLYDDLGFKDKYVVKHAVKTL